MASRITERPAGITVSSSWPYERMPTNMVPKRKSTGWVLALSIDPILPGVVTYYPAGTGKQVLHLNDGSLWGKKVTPRPFYRVATKEECEKFVVTFCMQDRGEPYPKLVPHQDGIFWLLNWSSMTAANVAIASQIADHYFNDRYDAAWAVGRGFERLLVAAENAYWEAMNAEKAAKAAAGH